jgi:hypothetical protein
MQLSGNLGAQLGELHWIEITRAADEPVSQAARELIGEALERNRAIESSTVPGQSFWSSTETVWVPALIERTVEILAAI